MTHKYRAIPLGKSGRWLSGGTPSKENPAYWGGDIPWISAKSMYDVYLFDSELKVTEEGANNGTRKIPAGTVLILVRGSMLYNRIPICITTRQVTFNQDVKAIIPNPDIEPKYLLYWLIAHERILLSMVESTGIGAGKLSTDLLTSLKLPVPPIEEQRKIAGILSTWDEAIRLTQALIAGKRQRKKGLMQRLLTGQVGFPGFVKQQWFSTTLNEIADIILSNIDKKIKSGQQIVRLCNYTDVFNNDYITNSMPFMESSASEREIERFTLQKHDVIITKDSETSEEIAEPAVVIEDLTNVLCGYHLAILRPDASRVYGPFLKDLLMTPLVRYQFARKANGITRFGLTKDTIHGIRLTIPSPEEQHRIAAVLQTCDREIHLLQQKLAALQQQKKGLMQRLLTGELRTVPPVPGKGQTAPK